MGGTKAHPLTLMTPEDIEEARRRHDQAQAETSALRQGRSNVRRARRYQLQDEQRAYDREIDQEQRKFGQQQSLLGQEYGQRRVLQGDEIAGRFGLAEFGAEQDRLRAQDQYGYQRGLAQQGYGFELGLGDQRIGGQEDLANLSAELQAKRDDAQFGYEMLGKEFDVGTEIARDERQTIAQNWLGERTWERMTERDKALFSNDMTMEEIRHGWDAVQRYEERGWQLDDKKSLHENAKELLGLERQWGMKAQEAEFNLNRLGATTDRFFQSRYANSLRTQEEIRRGLRYLTDEDERALQSLESAYGKQLRSTELDPQQKADVLSQIENGILDVYEGAREVPAHKRQKSMQEEFDANTVTAEDGSRWTRDANGVFRMEKDAPDPGVEYKAQQEQRKAEQERASKEQEVQWKQFDNANTDYYKAKERQDKYIESHTVPEEIKDEKAGKSRKVSSYVLDNGSPATLAEVRAEAERMIPAVKPKSPAQLQAEQVPYYPVVPQWPAAQLPQVPFQQGPGVPQIVEPMQQPAEQPGAGPVKQQLDPSSPEPPEVQGARKLIEMSKQYLGPRQIGPSGAQIEEAQAMVDEWESQGTTPTLRRRQAEIQAFNQALPRFDTQAGAEAALEAGQIMSGDYIYINGKKKRVQ